jgi:SAM-dependent methyltransferase
MIESPLAYSHTLLRQCVREGDVVVDATIGHGHDTVLLARLVGPTGRVLGFDIQPEAVESTRAKLIAAGLDGRITLFHESHEHAAARLGETQTIGAAQFNLGYLPGGDKDIVTQGSSTLRCLEGLLPRLRPGGMAIFVVYYGHDGGPEEKDALLAFVDGLDQKAFTVLQYSMRNWRSDPPFLIAIEKR